MAEAMTGGGVFRGPEGPRFHRDCTERSLGSRWSHRQFSKSIQPSPGGRSACAKATARQARLRPFRLRPKDEGARSRATARQATQKR